MTVYLFSGFRLDTTKSELFRGNELLKVEPQTIAILELLVERAGQLVLKEQLIQQVWGGRVIERSVLDNRIRSVRLAIGDSGKNQTFIKTYPNRGYKFIASVEKISTSDNVSTDNSLSAGSTLTGFSIPQFARRHGKLVLGGIGTSVVVALTAAFILLMPSFGVKNAEATTSEKSSSQPQTSAATSVSRPVIRVIPIEFASETSVDEKADAQNFSVRTVAYFAAIPGFEVIADAAAPNAQLALNSKSMTGQTVYRLRTSLNNAQPSAAIDAVLENDTSGEVIWSKRYQISAPPLASSEWTDAVARNIALISANKLGVSTSVVDQQSVDFDIAQDYHTAIRLMRSLDPEGIEGARGLLNDIIEREPDYLPAHAGVYDLSHIELVYTDSDLEEMFVRMANAAEKLRAIAPNAPETITVNAVDSEFDLTELTQASQTPLDLLSRAVAEAPNYFRSHEEIANLYRALDENEKAISHYNSALSLLPDCPILLAQKSSAQMCTGDILQALATAKMNVRRSPGHSYAKVKLLEFAMQTADYAYVQQELPALTASENLGYQESILAMNWSLMVGDYETAQKFAFDPQEQAYVHALRGDEEAATQAAAEMAGYYYSARALHILGDDSLLLSLLENEFQQPTGFHNEGHELTLCHTPNAAYVAHATRERFPENSAALRENLARYFHATDTGSFRHINQYAGLAGFLLLEGDTDGAIQAISEANDAGFVFLHRLDDPTFNALRGNEAFAIELERMRRKASSLRELVVLPS